MSKFDISRNLSSLFHSYLIYSESKAASLASRLVESNKSANTQHSSDELEDEDAIFAELEEEIENDGSYYMREKGLERMRNEMGALQTKRDLGHGKLSELTDEKEIIRITARNPRCLVHFFHNKFQRCAIMDKHLSKLAPKYFDTLFLRVFVENVPWLVERLGIKILPCVICFVDGIAKERLVGFEELGNEDGFETATLELRLSMTGKSFSSHKSLKSVDTIFSGVIKKAQGRVSGLDTVYSVSTGRNVQQDEPEFDLDE
ncbi:thioredoxin-like protein [Flagelloscypha sp. PMI_526]|nr:thioredoxin-like protein [Flagelloscypha sp. PMI_526]